MDWRRHPGHARGRGPAAARRRGAALLACTGLALALGGWRRHVAPAAALAAAGEAAPEGERGNSTALVVYEGPLAEAEAGPPRGRPRARVGPSLLAGDLANLSGEAQRVVEAGADFIHLDIFDGNWIPGAFTFGPLVVKALRSHVPSAFLDAHLCVAGPERYVEALAEAGVDRFTFHVEAVADPLELAARIHARGLKAGLALAPETPVDERVLDLARVFDVVNVMTVPPGFGGQAFMPEVLPKVSKLRAAYPDKALEVDGGVNERTVGMAAFAGADEVVAGTAVFRADDSAAVIWRLRQRMVDNLEARASE